MSNAKDAPIKVSPLAGKPATPPMLVDVPRLVTAYYTDVPDFSVQEQRVAFGTSGHRGSAFENTFNEWHVPYEKALRAATTHRHDFLNAYVSDYKIYAESFRGADHLRRILADAQAIVGAALAAPLSEPETASRTDLKETL